jgi:hypothetical protein
MPPTPVLFFAAIIAVIVGFSIYRLKLERQRTAALGPLAASLGLTFDPKSDQAAVRALGDVQLFARGHSKRVTNLMTGTLEGRRLAVFDYQFTTGGGKAQRTSAQTVVLLPGLKPSLPDLQMAPENPFHKIAEAYGEQDIDLASAPEFSRRYIVKGKDEAAVRAALTPEVTSYFVAHQGWWIEAQAGTVAIYRGHTEVKPGELRQFIADACEVASRL